MKRLRWREAVAGRRYVLFLGKARVGRAFLTPNGQSRWTAYSPDGLFESFTHWDPVGSLKKAMAACEAYVRDALGMRSKEVA